MYSKIRAINVYGFKDIEPGESIICEFEIPEVSDALYQDVENEYDMETNQNLGQIFYVLEIDSNGVLDTRNSRLEYNNIRHNPLFIGDIDISKKDRAIVDTFWKR